MAENNLEEFQLHLERLAQMLPGMMATQREWPPRSRELLGQVVEALADADFLEALEYYTIDQAQTKIGDIFQEGKIPRFRTFNHCGQDHVYHALQCWVRCPICKTYRMRTHGGLGNDDIETVAWMALYWLKIDRKTIPGWNPACD